MNGGTQMRGLWVCLGLVLQLACGAPSEQSASRSPVDATLTQLGDAFVSSTANVNGMTLHFVRAGSGPAVILLHIRWGAQIALVASQPGFEITHVGRVPTWGWIGETGA